jgi:antitoxin YefM
MSESFPLGLAKSRLSELVERVHRTHERVTITRHGSPDAVLVAPEDLDALEDTLDLLSDPEAMREIAQARVEEANGDWIDADQLRARYLSPRHDG